MAATWTYPARVELASAFQRIRSDNPEAALRFLRQAKEAAEKIAEYPGSGTVRPEIDPSIRTRPFGKYIIIYEPTQDGILVLRFIEGHRNISELFRDRSF